MTKYCYGIVLSTVKGKGGREVIVDSMDHVVFKNNKRETDSIFSGRWLRSND